MEVRGGRGRGLSRERSMVRCHAAPYAIVDRSSGPVVNTSSSSENAQNTPQPADSSVSELVSPPRNVSAPPTLTRGSSRSIAEDAPSPLSFQHNTDVHQTNVDGRSSASVTNQYDMRSIQQSLHIAMTSLDPVVVA